VKKEIVIICACFSRKIVETIPQLINFAMGLGEKAKRELKVILLGPEKNLVLGLVNRKSVQKIIMVEHDLLDIYLADKYVSAVIRVLATSELEIAPEKLPVIILAGDDYGKDLAPRLAARLELDYVANVVDINLGEGKTLGLCEEPALADGMLEIRKIKSNDRVEEVLEIGIEYGFVATIRRSKSNVQVDCQGRLEVPVEVIELNEGVLDDHHGASVTMVRKRKIPESERGIEWAKLLVGIGRGVGDLEGADMVRELAGLLGASVGGSRAAVDEGWLDFDSQIGQTGKVVSPQLYLACGISGSIYHMLGLRDSQSIIAVNKSQGAEIFYYSDIGFVADIKEFVPVLVKKLAELKQREESVRNKQL